MPREDNTLQIERGERTREFDERWTAGYPDPSTSVYPVFLRINGAVIKELPFISLDGGRIFVPMPGFRSTSTGLVDYFWNLNSLEVKVCRVIGEYYIYEDLEGVARKSGVSIVG